MKTGEDYRTIAENCIRKAQAAQDERDKPLWATMAQSWLRLAEHRERIDHSFEAIDVTHDDANPDKRPSKLN